MVDPTLVVLYSLTNVESDNSPSSRSSGRGIDSAIRFGEDLSPGGEDLFEPRLGKRPCLSDMLNGSGGSGGLYSPA
jgi:hypothetical protein